jgi:hypothetical protein
MCVFVLVRSEGELLCRQPRRLIVVQIPNGHEFSSISLDFWYMCSLLHESKQDVFVGVYSVRGSQANREVQTFSA